MLSCRSCRARSLLARCRLSCSRLLAVGLLVGIDGGARRACCTRLLNRRLLSLLLDGRRCWRSLARRRPRTLPVLLRSLLLCRCRYLGGARLEEGGHARFLQLLAALGTLLGHSTLGLVTCWQPRAAPSGLSQGFRSSEAAQLRVRPAETSSKPCNGA